MGILTDRLNGPGHVLITYQNMIRSASIDIVKELKQNLENEPEYAKCRHKTQLDNEFSKRLGE